MQTQWRAPRPRGLPRLRDAVADQIETGSMPGSLGDTAGDDFASAMLDGAMHYLVGRELRAQVRDLRDSTLYWTSGYVAMMAAQVAQADRLAPHLELTERAYALQPDAAPSKYGFMVFVLPVAGIGGKAPREIVAVSWTPTRDEALVDGGLDLTAWTPTTPDVISDMLTSDKAASAGVEHLAWRYVLMRGTTGPLLPVTRVSWGHLQPVTQHKDAASWLVAVHVTWLAMATSDMSVTAVRPRRWRRRPAWAESGLFRVQWRRGAAPLAANRAD